MADKEKKDVVLIVAQDGFRDEEYFEPKKALEEAGWNVRTASMQAGTALGKLGGKTEAELSISDINVDDYAGLVFVGGPGSADYFTDETALGLAREACEKEKVVGAICIAPGILARAGILKGKKATVYPSEKESLQNSGAILLETPVVADGNIVTASGPDAAKDFGLELAKVLQG